MGQTESSPDAPSASASASAVSVVEHQRFWTCARCLSQSNRTRSLFCNGCLTPRDDVKGLIGTGPLTADEAQFAPRVFVVGVGGCSRSGKSTLCAALSEYYQTPPPLCVDSYFMNPPRYKLSTGRFIGNLEDPKSVNFASMKEHIIQTKLLIQRSAILEARGLLSPAFKLAQLKNGPAPAPPSAVVANSNSASVATAAATAPTPPAVEASATAAAAASATPLPLTKRLEPRVMLVEGFLLFCDSAHEAFGSLIDTRLFVTIPKAVAKVRRMTTTPVSSEYFEECIWPGYLKFGLPVSLQPRFVDPNPAPNAFTNPASAGNQPSNQHLTSSDRKLHHQTKTAAKSTPTGDTKSSAAPTAVTATATATSTAPATPITPSPSTTAATAAASTPASAVAATPSPDGCVFDSALGAALLVLDGETKPASIQALSIQYLNSLRTASSAAV